MIKAIIFDCFGVVFQDNFGPLYEYFGGDLEKDRDLIADIMHKASSGKITNGTQLLAEHLGTNLDSWNEARNEMDNQGLDYELLKYVKELRKNYKVGMLSNVGPDGLGKYMDYNILNDHFEVVVESAKIGFAKPEARAYEIAADKLGVRLDECIFIDDREEYIEGAVHVGMSTVLYTDLESLKKELEKELNNEA
jgi:putative hydrolase of the HAD superfamily